MFGFFFSKDIRLRDFNLAFVCPRNAAKVALYAESQNVRLTCFSDFQHIPPKKKKKLADKILPQKVRDLVPESQAYMDLLAFERKLDATIMRKRLDIQEALKRPMKQKRKLRIFISNTFYPGKENSAEGNIV